MNIWVSGCFDILHTGHLRLLKYAKDYGGSIDPEHNILYVGIDSDERVRMLKGDKRPVNDQFDRARMVSGLKPVDSVVIFNDEDELKNFIKVFNIDYIIAGDHYKDKIIVGAELAKHGVVYYPTDERSTTGIIERIKHL